MRSRFDTQLEELNLDLIKMGALVETAIETAVNALIKRDQDLAQKLIELEKETNEMERNIESRCMKLLLQQQPVASDLRLIGAALKMITDMERIGDNAADIAEISTHLGPVENSPGFLHIPQMAQSTISMVKRSVDAFVNRDKIVAQAVITDDDTVDALFRVIRSDLIGLIRTEQDFAEQAIDLMMIAKYFERIGDHAQNIAEWVVFAITGQHKSQEFME